MDRALELMLAEIHHYEGTVNQVMGDGIIALFGAPLAHEDHAVRALRDKLARLNARPAVPTLSFATPRRFSRAREE